MSKVAKEEMQQNEKYHHDYVAFINTLLTRGHAYKVPDHEVITSQPTWYLPHHGVYHPKNPDKK